MCRISFWFCGFIPTIVIWPPLMPCLVRLSSPLIDCPPCLKNFRAAIKIPNHCQQSLSQSAHFTNIGVCFLNHFSFSVCVFVSFLSPLEVRGNSFAVIHPKLNIIYSFDIQGRAHTWHNSASVTLILSWFWLNNKSTENELTSFCHSD